MDNSFKDNDNLIIINSKIYTKYTILDKKNDKICEVIFDIKKKNHYNASCNCNTWKNEIRSTYYLNKITCEHTDCIRNLYLDSLLTTNKSGVNPHF